MRDEGPELSALDYAQLAELHATCLPESMFTAFGARFLRRYYQFVSASGSEWLFVERLQGRCVGACVLSMSTHTLEHRLVANAPVAIVLGITNGLRSSTFRARLRRRGNGGRTPLEVRGLPEVVQIYSEAARRGTGIGKRLLSRVEATLRRLHKDAYFIKTSAADANAALMFYSRLGFTKVGVTDVSGKPYVFMRKSV